MITQNDTHFGIVAALRAGSVSHPLSSLRNLTKDSLFRQRVAGARAGSSLEEISHKPQAGGGAPERGGSLTLKEEAPGETKAKAHSHLEGPRVADLLQASQAGFGLRSQLGSCAKRSSSPQSRKTPHQALAAVRDGDELQTAEQPQRPPMAQSFWFEHQRKWLGCG